MFTKVVVANRGEIAVRVIRTLREMGLSSVAIYSDADRSARHVYEADEAYRVGPAPASRSYLSAHKIVQTALRAGADAVHPGYGFLAENAAFARDVATAGLTFIGPDPVSIELMGDKIAARRIAREAGVPVVPGTEGPVGSLKEARAFIAAHGLPVLVKAGGGGGGRGIRIVESQDQLEESLERAAREAESSFNNREVYLERYFSSARHLEVQIVGDRLGDIVAWGERDCSTQRRRQKLIEETPAPRISRSDRRGLMDAASSCAGAVNYVGLGTVEFLYTGPGEFWFLEMNTRIQVEHPVTEEVTGRDLVREGIEVCAGRQAASRIDRSGHSIEARINAEDPARGFTPGPGLITRYQEPGGPGVRVDSGVYQGFVIPRDYDSLMAKLIVRAATREEARVRLIRALSEFHIDGVPTTIPLIKRIVESDAFRAGGMTTTWLDTHVDELAGPPQAPSDQVEESTHEARAFDVEVNGKRFTVNVRSRSERERHPSRKRTQRTPTGGTAAGRFILSPMHGTVISIAKSVGDAVEEDETVFVVEAMKMENEVSAPRRGIIAAMRVAVGDTIEVNQELAELEALE
jgi:acetyl-CoA/propionyl-CoA carboxylase, biotin carboxylase, biotin carboxyl carrier protein